MAKTKTAKPEQTHIAMVLDRSGSMDSCREATIEAVNKYLLEARGDKHLAEADFELSIFDSQSIDIIRTGAVTKVADLTASDYMPRGGTPLYDAIGRGIDGLDAKLAKAGTKKAILVVVTDGFENASRKYNHEAIQELIKGRQADGWLVVFLGAGLGAAQQGLALGVRAGTVANIGTSKGALRGMAANTMSMSSGYAATQDFAEAQAYSISASFSTDARKQMGDASAGAGLLGQPGGGVSNKPPASAPVIVPVVPVDADTWSASGDVWGQ